MDNSLRRGNIGGGGGVADAVNMPEEPTQSPNSNSARKLNGQRTEPGTARDYIAVARGSDLVVVRVVGKGSMLTAPALAAFAEDQRRAGFKRFVFDLERCRGLDSTFMGVMVGIHTALEPGKPGDAAGTPVPQAAAPCEQNLDPLSPEEAADMLNQLFTSQAALQPLQSPPAQRSAGPAVVCAVNVPPDVRNLMTMLGVDRFVKLHGTCDLKQIETTILAEKNVTPEQHHRLILQAHKNLVEIDQRNQAQFGPFLQSLSAAIAQDS
jgi:hypothetical protein